MIANQLNRLRTQPRTNLHSGVDEQTIRRVLQEQAIRLPTDHLQLLKMSNGLELFDGYERLFGIDCTESIDAIIWNQLEWWKFAWSNRCSGFWCFGESVWGHQYAYALDDLNAQDEPSVYDLDAYEMVAEKIADSFAEFLALIMIREEPIDRKSRDAYLKFGAIDANTNLIHTPPFVVLPQDEMDNLETVVTMDSRLAMICNGDASLQLANAPDNALFKGVEAVVDQQGRSRINLLWD